MRYIKKNFYKQFKKSQKLLGINFYDPKKLEIENSRLILDYVIVESDMWVINKPFNLIKNHNTNNYEPCLVILVAALEIKGKVYPIDFAFWQSEIMTGEDEVYLTKNEIAEEMINRLVRSYKIKEIIFDAGFCDPFLLETISKLGINYICRFPKSRKIKRVNNSENAKKIFKDSRNGEFYYYKGNGYLNSCIGEYANHKIQLVVVANKKDKLISKDFYCLLTNNLNLKYPTVLKNYKNRGKIEDLFKKLKTYMGLTVTNRHNEDYIIDRINLTFTGFVIVQEYSSKIKKTFHRTLEHIKGLNQRKLKVLIDSCIKKVFLDTDNTAFQV